MWFTRLAIARPIVIWMVLTAIAVLGVQAYFRLPAELNPKTDIPVITITTVFPGAGPSEVEQQLSKPLEEAVGTVGGVKNVYSSSQSNVSIISIDLKVGTNLDVAAAEIRERIDSARSQLPADAKPPVVAKLDINALPILTLGVSSPSLRLSQLRYLVDNQIKPRIERAPGVAGVTLLGGENREVHVDVDPQRLSQNGITLEDVVHALKSTGRDIPLGDISHGARETDVRLSGAFQSLDDIREVQIPVQPSITASSQSSPLPQPLTIADVADVNFDISRRTEIDRINGRDGIGISLIKSSDANTVHVVQEVRRELELLVPDLPKDLVFVTLRDDAVIVQDALQDVNFTLVLGAVLAMAVILLFLHNLRGTFIVSMAIPACIVATFLAISMAGFTLNQMTLLALSLSVGILVDDSIVVLESITRHLKLGEPPRQAAVNGRSEIGFADITTTLVDVVVFVPIAFMGGIVGGFFKQFGLTIAVATLFSLIVSFTITPSLASRWYRSGKQIESTNPLFVMFDRLYAHLEKCYRNMLRSALSRRKLVVFAGVAALGLIFLLSYHKLGVDLLPTTDQGQVTVALEMPPGSSLSATDTAARIVEKEISSLPDVAATICSVGQILGGFGMIPQQGSQFAQINVRLKERESSLDRLLHGNNGTRTHSDQEITQILRLRLAKTGLAMGTKITAAAVRGTEGTSMPVQLELRSRDNEKLSQFAQQVKAEMAKIRGVLDADLSMRNGRPEIRANIDPRRAAQFGIPVGIAGAILRDSISGNSETTYREGGQEIPIRIQLRSASVQPDTEVANLIIGSDPQGQPVLLGDIADIVTRTGPANIDRKNYERLVTISANLSPGTALGDVQSAIDKILKRLPHAGIASSWGGEVETLNESAMPFASALILAVILVYLVMASLFNSLGTPFVIMFTLPMALIGALGALVLTGERLSLVSGIGIIMLVGLMGRNAILLLDFTNTLRKRGMSRSEAIQEAGAARLRPILMTTSATIIGMLPVALRVGRASEMRAPMAIVVIGGLLVSTVLTLIMIPVLYSLLEDWTQRFRSKSRKSEML